MDSCPRCGTQASAGDRFCRECGGYLSTTPGFDDLEPPNLSHEDTDNYGFSEPIQFSGPAVPAIDDDEPPMSPYPVQRPPQEPTMEGWAAEPPTSAWYAEEAADGVPSGGVGERPEPYGHASWAGQQGGYDQRYAGPRQPGPDPLPFDEGTYDPPPYGAEPRRKRRSGLLVAGLAVLTVIILVTVGAVVLSNHNGNDPARASDTGSPSTSKGGSGTPTPKATTPAQQAKAVDDLLSKAAGGKNLLATAYEQASDCEIGPAAAERKFEQAAKSRRGIVRSARALDTAKLDNGPRIKSLMISMYNTSAKADDAFATWAHAGVENGDSCLGANSKRAKGNTLSVKAGKTKKLFVQAWNPVAVQYGHTKRTKNGL